jgi:hypothetical protein
MGWGVRDARRVQRKRVGVREFFVSKWNPFQTTVYPRRNPVKNLKYNPCPIRGIEKIDIDFNQARHSTILIISTADIFFE